MKVGAKYVELLADNRQSRALLVGYSPSETKRIQQSWASSSRTSPKGSISANVIDQLSKAVPTVAAGLANGSMFQVVGTPALVEGLKAGTHALVQTSGGTLGTVVSTSTGQIAGQLRFAPSSMAPVIAPFAVWSVLNGIAGTFQLQRISRRLDIMTRQMEVIALRQEADALGRVYQSINALDEIIDEYAHTGRFSDLARERLSIAEHVIGSILERNKVIIAHFADRVEVIRTKKGAQGAEQAAALLQEEGGSIIHDMQLLNGLLSAQARVYQAHLSYDLMENPEYVDRRMENINRRMQEHKTVIEAYPTVSDLQSHAEKCIEEMNWFKRKLFYRSTVKRVREASTLSDPFSDASENSVIPNFVFWQEEGDIQARIAPPASATRNQD